MQTYSSSKKTNFKRREEKEKTKEDIKSYWVACKNNTYNIDSKKVTIANKVIREKSRRDNCVFNKSRFLKPKPNNKSSSYINLKLFLY